MIQVHKTENVSQAVISTPPVIISSLSLAGVSLQDWVLLATLGWIAMQAGWFAYARYKEWRSK